MPRKFVVAVGVILALVAVYLLVWPVPVNPVAWQAPPAPGYVGPFSRNERLKGLEMLSIGDNHGPETVALDAEGRIYATTHEGRIVRLQADGSKPENWVTTGGRPLGIRFDPAGNLVVADAFRGLLRIAPDGTVTVLATEADGKPILYANSVDVAADGKIYFSDASTKFGASQWGGTYPASLLDILEHGAHGRLLVYDPAAKKTTSLVAGLNFANGVAIAHDQSYVLVNETGTYRVLRHWIAGSRRGVTEPLIENLPGFPDNLSSGLDGRFWLALISPRNKLVDQLSDAPFARAMIQRLPTFVRPKAVAYGHVVAIDGMGRVLASLQDPDGSYRLTTGATEAKDCIYVGSLVMPALGRLPKSQAGLFSPVSAEVQEAAKVARIGYLTATVGPFYQNFLRGLRDLGYVEGRNVVVEYRSAEGKIEQLPALAAELVGLKVDVIVAAVTVAALAAKQVTRTIPIVFPAVSDPVGTGLVAGFARPGGNVTGLSFFNPELLGKSLELLKQAAPGARRVAVLWQPTGFAEQQGKALLKAAEVAAHALGVRLQIVEVRGPDDFDGAFAEMTRARADALMVPTSATFFQGRRRLADLAAKNRLPAVYPMREFVEDGGLMSYGPILSDQYRRAATYVDKILKGAGPADLPVEQPTKFELVINSRTAKALGLTIPQSVLARADHVVEK